MDNSPKKLRIALLYPYAPHYRLPIFRELMDDPEIQYTLISDTKSRVGIRCIDPLLAERPVSDGGIDWLFIKNLWLYKEVFLWQFGALKRLRGNNFDGVVFHGNIYILSTWIALVYCKMVKMKVFMWTHGVATSKTGIVWALRKIFYRASDVVMLYGNRAREVMISNGMEREKLTVIYNSVDNSTQIKLRSGITAECTMKVKNDFFGSPDLPLLIFVGRLTRQKRLDMIVDASELLERRGVRVNTMFVGDGEMLDVLKGAVEEKNLAHLFHFFGACYDEEVLSQLVGAADICVSPGEVGLTGITSLAFGTPVISHSSFDHQMPEYEAIIPGVNGDLFEYGSVVSLTDAVEKWVDGVSGLSRDEIRDRCYKVVDKTFNPKNQANLINAAILHHFDL